MKNNIQQLCIFIGILISIYSCADTKQAEAKSKKEKTPVATKNHKKKDTTSKVFLITMDGLRWQELFTGADAQLINHTEFVSDTTILKKDFWRVTPEERRKTMMPFFWMTIAKQGVIYGNRSYDNKVNLTNNHWFSYPGYSEILCGFADDKRISSNDKIDNPNITILEHLNIKEHFKEKVAAFGSWDVFPFIINENRSKLPINAGFGLAKGELTAREAYLNKLQKETPSPWSSVRLDVFTHNYALEYIQKKHPKIVFISYGETDDFAHDGKYDQYLYAARRTDQFISDLWQYIQQDTFYKDNTTLIITTDHGRGTNPIEDWQHHGNNLKYHGKTFVIKGADQVWLAAIGKDVKAKGEQKGVEQLYSNQIAATIMELLGEDYNEPRAGKSIKLQLEQ